MGGAWRLSSMQYTSGSSFVDKAIHGHLRTTSLAEGDFDPAALDVYLAPGSVTPFREATATYGAVSLPVAFTSGSSSFFDCRDQQHGAPVWSSVTDCQANGLFYTSVARVWEGSPLPSTSNVYAGTSVTNVDAWGRVLGVRSDGDLRRNDDDTCATITYASGAPFPSAVTSVTIDDCGSREGHPITLSVRRFLYDGLPFGQVSTGRVTSRLVDRYSSSGVYQATYTEASFLYDAFGEVGAVIATRTLGGSATRTSTFTRDAFGMTITQVSEAASDVATTMVAKSQASTWPSRGASSTDPSGTITQVEFDGFGRPTRTSVTTGGQRWTLGTVIYDDATTGRRVIADSFPGNTAYGAEAFAPDRSRSITRFDALGRPRFTLTELGTSYPGRSIISGLVERDTLGRVVFAASPFEAGGSFIPDGVARHGTTFVYDVRGRLVRTTEAIGRNETATTTDVAAKIYVATSSYAYSNGNLVINRQGPDERDPTSSRFGYVDQALQTALGYEFRRQRLDAGSVVRDLVEQSRDPLGRVMLTRRYPNPNSSASSVVWTDEFDSLGNLVKSTEPGIARTQTYDEFGALLESAWMDGTTRRVSRAKYDGFGRVVEQTLASTPSGGAEVVESRDVFHYDVPSGDVAQPTTPGTALRGQLSWVENAAVGSVYYAYDSFGRSTSQTYKYLGLPGPVTEATDSTAGGQLSALRLTTEVTDDKISYGYDTAGRMRTVKLGASTLMNASAVSPLGEYQAVDFGNGVAEKYTFATTGRRELQSWSAVTASGTYTFELLQRDGAGRITQERHATPTTSLRQDSTYDGLGRLLSRAASTGGLPTMESFLYDGLGNLTLRTTTTGVSFQYTADTSDTDRLCRYAAPGTTGACQFTYDGAGNVTKDTTSASTRTLVYDAGQRLTQVARGNSTVKFTYGPAGRMKAVVTGTGKRTIWSIGSFVERRTRPDGITQLQRVIPGPLGGFVSLRSELDAAGKVVKTEAIYNHGDGRANRLFTKANGQVAQAATYNAFGQLTAGASDNSLTGSDDLWNGGDDFPEVGITLLGPRAYDPALGRFLERDPLAFLSRSATANPYAFSFNDPTNVSHQRRRDDRGAAGREPRRFRGGTDDRATEDHGCR